MVSGGKSNPLPPAQSKARSDGTDAAGFSGARHRRPDTLRPCVRQGRTNGGTAGAMGNGRRQSTPISGIAAPRRDDRDDQTDKPNLCPASGAVNPGKGRAGVRPWSQTASDHQPVTPGRIGGDQIARRRQQNPPDPETKPGRSHGNRVSRAGGSPGCGRKSHRVTLPDGPETAAPLEKRQIPAFRPARSPRPSTPARR